MSKVKRYDNKIRNYVQNHKYRNHKKKIKRKKKNNNNRKQFIFLISYSIHINKKK